MVKFYICVATCLIACTILLLGFGLRLDHILTSIYNVLCKVFDSVRPIDSSIQSAWSTILCIRDDTSKMTGLLDKDEDESEEETDISEGGWTTAPCPVCGGPAYVDYNLPAGDGYCVMCGKNTKEYEHCDYGIVAGGPTRKIAAFEWNKAAMTYCNKKMSLSLCELCPHKNTDMCKTCNLSASKEGLNES